VTAMIRVPDGRRLSVEFSGHPDGRAVFLLHGMPGSRLGPRPRGMVLYRLGIKLIAFDRPGYGDSDRQAGRRVADVVADVTAIADAYGIERFAVAGRSGGGPHALACAALLPDRVTRAAVLVSLAPPGAAGLDWFDGMAQSNVVSFIAAAAGHDPLAARLTLAAQEIRANPASWLARLHSELPDSDRRVVGDAGIRALLVAAHAEALRTSVYGWIDDAMALCGHWGFDPASVTVPVLLWHGEHDVFSPVSHARWLAKQIPGATVIVQAGAAHFGALNVLPDVLRWLVSKTQPERLGRLRL
jgi:pimeloyl-ACP methyl ester carboxylesterase